MGKEGRGPPLLPKKKKKGRSPHMVAQIQGPGRKEQHGQLSVLMINTPVAQKKNTALLGAKA